MSSKNNKRRKTDDTITHITELPVGIIVDVSEYLSKPSRAILAVAFTAPSSSWKNKNNYSMHSQSSSTSKAIVAAQQWDALDFEDVEKSLAIKLSDDDMYAVLQCINAQDVLKKLKLTGCINITGLGLNPLNVRQTVVLEQIDLSLLKQYENPDGYIDGSSEIHHLLSKDIVLPILNSIVSVMGSSLKYILLPYNWRTDDQLQQFVNRYNQRLDGINCSNCTEPMWGYGFYRVGTMYHYNTCYSCLKHYCDECSNKHRVRVDKSLSYCGDCKKDYCNDCGGSPRNRCLGCCTMRE